MKINKENFYLNIEPAISISKSGYLHLPILYLGFGKWGFSVLVVGISITVRFGKKNLDK